VGDKSGETNKGRSLSRGGGRVGVVDGVECAGGGWTEILGSNRHVLGVEKERCEWFTVGR
jgi:hypothetical protein